MKRIIKILIVLGIAVAIFGAATVKEFLYKGVDFTVEKTSQGVQKLKESEKVQQAVGEITSGIKEVGSSAIAGAKSSLTDKITDSIDKLKK